MWVHLMGGRRSRINVGPLHISQIGQDNVGPLDGKEVVKDNVGPLFCDR